MQTYDDITNAKGLYILFSIFQAFMLLIVYSIVYTSFIAAKIASEKYGLTFMVYLPAMAGLIGYPVILYKTRKLFQKEKRLRAVVWVMAWAFVIIVGLYLHLSKIAAL
jgi:hypothetical protein